jgi:hypothetical protein
MSWKPEARVKNEWCRNGLAFLTEQEALQNARDLMWRWVNVEEVRAVEVLGEPANYHWVEGEGLVAIVNGD